MVQLLKVSFRVERPWVIIPSLAPVESALTAASGYSFPSAHTQTAASVYGYLGLTIKNKWWKVILLTIVLMVAVSRLYLGVHTLTDVLVSLALCLILIILLLWLLQKEVPDSYLLGGLAALSTAGMVYAFVLYGNEVVTIENLSGCCKAAGGCFGCALGFYLEKHGIHFQTQTKHVWQQPLKLIAGLVGLLALRSMGRTVLGSGPAQDALLHALLALWVLAIYPLLFQRLLGAQRESTLVK